MDRSSGASYDFEMYLDGPDLKFRGGANAAGSSLNYLATFRANGNVGIGVPLPDNALDISGDVNIKAKTGSTDLLLLETDDGTDVLEITGGLNPQAKLNGFWDINSPEEGLSYPDPTKAIEVNASFFMNSLGQIKIGALGTPQKDIHIKQSNSTITRGIRMEYETSSNYWDVYVDGSDDYNFGYNGSLRAYIQDGSGSFVINSDRRFKDDIKYLGSTLGKINALKPATYKYKVDRSKRNNFGLIAQELQEVYPEMVYEKDGKLGVAYDGLIPVAIKGIQELSEENKALRSELEILKAEMAEIKALLKKITTSHSLA